MKMEWKRPAAFCLAAAMVLGLNGMPVLAATPETALPATAETAAAPEAPAAAAEEGFLRQNMLFSLGNTVKATGSFTVSGGEENTDYSYSGGVLTIKSGDLTVAMEVGAATSADRIVVDGGYKGTLTLENVSIDRSGAGDCAFALQSGANVTLNLTGNNTLKSGGTEAGLYVPVGATLTVTGGGDLTAYGSGEMSNGGAGIGGNGGMSFGTLVFEGTGTVTGNGGRAAGIGGGAAQSSSREISGSIIINSGTVTGNGGTYGAGIGTAADGGTNHVTILITGGTVTGNGNDYGAGIGSGLNGPGPAITITGGTVVGTSRNGAGIGCGGGGALKNPSGGSVIIEGGNVTAGGKPAIGAAEHPATVIISEGTLTTTGGIMAGGSKGHGSISITGGSVSATENAVVVGSGSDSISIGDFGALAPGEGGLSLGGTITVQDGETLTIPKEYPVTITGTVTVEGGKLEVPEGTELINNGLIVVQPGGTLTNNGTVSGSGALDNQGTLEGSGSLTCKITINNFNIGGAAEGDYTYENGVLTIHSGDLSLQNKTGLDTVTDRIVVEGGYTGALALEGVNIDRTAGGCAFALEDGANVTLNLTGNNTLKSGGAEAGLYVSAGATLTVTGAGSLSTQGGTDGDNGGAGIGGNSDTISFGTVNLKGTGTITATGGSWAAGIGSGGKMGYNGAVDGTILIASGTINATGNGAGIGISGGSGNGSVTISGGAVTADGGNGGVDINSPLFTGPNGQAVIYADSIGYTGNQSDWSCLVVGNGSATWYGTNNHITCDSRLDLNAGNLVIPEGSSLTVNRGIQVCEFAQLTVGGTLDTPLLLVYGENTLLAVKENGSLRVSDHFSLESGRCENDGSITLEGLLADFMGAVTNRGTIFLKGERWYIWRWNPFTNTENGIVEMDGGSLHVMSDATDGSFVNDGLLISTNGARVENYADYECRIFFDGNGGIPAKTGLVTENRVLTDLPGANRPGYLLEGWYTQAEGGEKVTAEYAFETGTTVYAHWTEAPAVSPTATAAPETTSAPAVQEDPSSAEHTLRFETNGGLPLEELRIGRGAKVELWPYNPVRTGYLFAGWYADEALTQPVTTVLMNADKTVYAAWTADPAATATAGQSGTAGSSQNGGAKPSAEPGVTPVPTAEPEVTPAPSATPETSAAPGTTAAPEAATPAPEAEGGLPLWPFLAGGAVIAAGAAFLLLRRRG